MYVPHGKLTTEDVLKLSQELLEKAAQERVNSSLDAKVQRDRDRKNKKKAK